MYVAQTDESVPTNLASNTDLTSKCQITDIVDIDIDSKLAAIKAEVDKQPADKKDTALENYVRFDANIRHSYEELKEIKSLLTKKCLAAAGEEKGAFTN